MGWPVSRPTYADVLAAHQKVVRLTAKMIGSGARENMPGYYADATERAEAEKEFEGLLKALVDRMWERPGVLHRTEDVKL